MLVGRLSELILGWNKSAIGPMWAVCWLIPLIALSSSNIASTCYNGGSAWNQTDPCSSWQNSKMHSSIKHWWWPFSPFSISVLSFDDGRELWWTDLLPAATINAVGATKWSPEISQIQEMVPIWQLWSYASSQPWRESVDLESLPMSTYKHILLYAIPFLSTSLHSQAITWTEDGILQNQLNNWKNVCGAQPAWDQPFMRGLPKSTIGPLRLTDTSPLRFELIGAGD